MMKKKLAITMGDPAGIGPEIILGALCSRDLEARMIPIVFGDLDLLRQRARKMKHLEIPPKFRVVTDISQIRGWAPGEIPVFNLSSLENVIPGVPSLKHAPTVHRYIETAAKYALQGSVAGVVTGPIHKGNLIEAGFDFPGHTEFFAQISGSVQVVMMMVAPTLKVALVTTHVPFSQIPNLLTVERVLRTILITDRALRSHFRLSNPRIAVAALNPHAGEGGKIGTEESMILDPAIRLAKAQHVLVSGPYSADTLFSFAAAGKYDAVVSMYHDQGLIPIKLLHFPEAVNVTLGLPFVRTSPDHGVAYDIAGSGTADPTSLKRAIEVALTMLENAA
ncbi:MAG: 4-hydroxythreonine-4-phosphate dehydrogenase PdxA [Deltaproteobacteria bacterium]|nr:MAG: 4-hydroxythreonine-4-phosphate dehydrogenase PdxA [Deltaproteobacteria bacterium]